MSTFFDRLAESTSSTWRLLSDTTNFLSRVKLLDSYETELRTWRAQLSRKRTDPQITKEVREEIVAVRKLLRLQGYDLRLGSKDIALEAWLMTTSTTWPGRQTISNWRKCWRTSVGRSARASRIGCTACGTGGETTCWSFPEQIRKPQKCSKT
jgi:hypothetical protein